MTFNPDQSKKTKEVILSRKVDKTGVAVVRTQCQKHRGLYLDEKLSFSHYIKGKISKGNKEIGMMKRLSNLFPGNSLVTIYKSFIRPHLDYYDVIYDQPNITST